MSTSKQLTTLLIDALAIELTANISMEELIRQIAQEVNNLIDTNFEKLVGVLYQMDVSEPKLKNLLASHPGADAGIIIAQLMIERQLQKIATRKQFRQKDNGINEDEKW